MPSDPATTGHTCPNPSPAERHRLARLLLDDADRFVPGAFADGVRHAAARLLDPGFATGEEPTLVRTPSR